MNEVTRGPILALDLATRTGWCQASPGGKIQYGSARMEGSSAGYKLNSFREWFLATVPPIDPWACVFEAPMSPHIASSIGTNADTALLLVGLVAFAEQLCVECRIPVVRQVDTQDMRGHFTGQRRFPKSQKSGLSPAKLATIARCKQLGFQPQDDNAADAIGIWHYAEAIWSPKTAAQKSLDAMMGGRL